MSSITWCDAPLPCEADKGWQAAMAGYRVAVFPGLWVDVKKINSGIHAKYPVDLSVTDM
jgi:hypothetical protein